MKATIITRIGVFAVAGAVLAGCATQQGTDTATGAVGGGAAGAALGEAIGGNGQDAAIGAAAGLAAGALLGHYWTDLTQRLGFGSDGKTKATQQPDGSLQVTLPGDSTFGKGRATLNTAMEPALVKVANEMKADRALTVEIRGFTDNSGSSLGNQRLSLQRAKSVENLLTQLGVHSNQIASVRGFGSDDPVADNNTAEGRAQNRRVELYLHRDVPQSAAQ